MINDLTKLDQARKNLMLFTTILLFLSLSKININTFTLLDITFDLSNAPKAFNSFNEVVSYLVVYFFIRFVSITSECKDYLLYPKSTLLKNSKEELSASLKIFTEKINDLEDKKNFESGVHLSRYIRYFTMFFEELFLHKNFSIFILPILYYSVTMIYFYIYTEATWWIHFTQLINFFGVVYLIMVMGIFSHLEKTIIKDKIRKLKYQHDLKEKYKNAKLVRRNKIRK